MIEGRMHLAWSLHRIEPVVLELTTQEGICESYWSGEVFGGHVHLTGQLVSVGHVACHVKRVPYSNSWLGIFNIFLFGREWSGGSSYLIFLYRAHIFLDTWIDLSV